jgi:hypothetical protein
MEVNEFRILHTYQALADAGFCDPLECKCGQSLIIGVDRETDSAILHCFACETKIRPGRRAMQKVQDFVKLYEGRELNVRE